VVFTNYFATSCAHCYIVLIDTVFAKCFAANIASVCLLRTDPLSTQIALRYALQANASPTYLAIGYINLANRFLAYLAEDQASIAHWHSADLASFFDAIFAEPVST